MHSFSSCEGDYLNLRVYPARDALIACPLTGEQAFERELAEAERIRPDIIEFRTDVLPLQRLSAVADTARSSDIGIMLTIKNADIARLLSETGNLGVCAPLLRYIDIELDDAEAVIDCAQNFANLPQASCGTAALNRAVPSDSVHSRDSAHSVISALMSFLEGGTQLVVSYHDYKASDIYSLNDGYNAVCGEYMGESVSEEQRKKRIVQHAEDGENYALYSLFKRFRALEYHLGVKIIPKIAVTPTCADSGMAFIENIKKYTHIDDADSSFSPQKCVCESPKSFERIICIPMGEQCSNLRLRAGDISHIAYACLLSPNAPGQLTVSDHRGVL